MVVYADRFVPEAEKTKARETGEDAKAVPFLKRFTVFNVAQCVGLRPETLTALARDPAPLPPPAILPHAEALNDATGAAFRNSGTAGFHRPGRASVAGSPQPAFRPTI